MSIFLWFTDCTKCLKKAPKTHQKVFISNKQTYSYLSLLSCVIMYPIIMPCRLVSISFVQVVL